MDFKEKKFEYSVGLIIIGVFGLMFALFKGITDRNPDFFSREVSYAMPRPPSQMPPDFSLDGREVDYNYNNPFAKKQKAEEKKKAEIKKVEAAKKQVAKTNQKKTADQKKPEVTVNTVDASASTLSETVLPNTRNNAPQTGARGGVAQGGTKQDKKAQDEKRSADQWRSLLNAQPTRENMDKMVAAYAKGELTSDGFYAVIEDLAKSQKSETQQVAVYGLSKTPSGKSFIVLAQHYETFNSDVKLTTEQVMTTYAQTSRIDALAQALSSGQSKVVFYAFQVLQRSISGSGSANSPRIRQQDNSGQGNSKYSRLIPVIQSLVKSTDVQVAQMATQILNQLGVSTGNQQVASQELDGQSVEMSSLSPDVPVTR